MKRIWILALCLALLVSLCVCSKTDKGAAASAAPTEEATATDEHVHTDEDGHEHEGVYTTKAPVTEGVIDSYDSDEMNAAATALNSCDAFSAVCSYTLYFGDELHYERTTSYRIKDKNRAARMDEDLITTEGEMVVELQQYFLYEGEDAYHYVSRSDYPMGQYQSMYQSVDVNYLITDSKFAELDAQCGVASLSMEGASFVSAVETTLADGSTGTKLNYTIDAGNARSVNSALATLVKAADSLYGAATAADLTGQTVNCELIVDASYRPVSLHMDLSELNHAYVGDSVFEHYSVHGITLPMSIDVQYSYDAVEDVVVPEGLENVG